MFWRIADLYDADSFVAHAASWEELGELAPDFYELEMKSIEKRLVETGSSPEAIKDFMERQASEFAFLPEASAAQLLFGAACVSSSFCAVAGARGQIFTNTEPFAEPAAPVKKAKGRKRGAKRPKAKIATLRLFTRSVHATHARALARFFARGGNSGFACKIDKSRYRRCHSPKRFHLDRGRHVFRVRAIGVTGKKGPAASAVIHVGNCRIEGHGKRCGSYVEN